MSMDVADRAAIFADHTVNLYRLLASSKRRLEFEEARDRLGLSEEQMRLVVDLLVEFFEADDFVEATV